MTYKRIDSQPLIARWVFNEVDLLVTDVAVLRPRGAVWLQNGFKLVFVEHDFLPAWIRLYTHA